MTEVIIILLAGKPLSGIAEKHPDHFFRGYSSYIELLAPTRDYRKPLPSSFLVSLSVGFSAKCPSKSFPTTPSSISSLEDINPLYS
jgi:hypothetical protein